MSIDDVESSTYRAAPMQLFRFAMGDVVFPYVGGHSAPFTWNNVDYMPDPVIELGVVDQSLAESSPDVELTISGTSAVAQEFIPFLPIEPIHVWVYRLVEPDVPDSYAPEFIGEVVSSSFDERTGVCTLTARMVSSALSRTVPWCVYSPTCARALYNIGCDVNQEDFVTKTVVVSGEGTAVLSSADFVTAALDHGVTEDDIAADWFRNGFIRHVPSNEVRTIIGHAGSEIMLHAPFTRLKDGDEVKAYPGCARTRRHCKLKFNNLNRHLAFPWQPNRNPYTQNVYGTGSKGSAGSGGGSPNSGNGVAVEIF